jgi:hypothetical protein
MHASVHDVDTSSARARTRCCLVCAQWRLGLLGTHAACRQCLCVCALRCVEQTGQLSMADSCRTVAHAPVCPRVVCLCVRNGLYAWHRRLVLRACSICAHEGSLPVCAWRRLPVRACACVMACTRGAVLCARSVIVCVHVVLHACSVCTHMCKCKGPGTCEGL